MSDQTVEQKRFEKAFDVARRSARLLCEHTDESSDRIEPCDSCIVAMLHAEGYGDVADARREALKEGAKALPYRFGINDIAELDRATPIDLATWGIAIRASRNAIRALRDADTEGADHGK